MIIKLSFEFMFVNLIKSKKMEFSDLGVVFDEGRQCSMKGMGVVSGLVKITEDDLERIMNDFDPIEAPPGPYIVQPQKKGKKILF